MHPHSMQRRLIAAVMLSQLLLAAGLLLAGVLYTHRRLLATLDAGLQSRADERGRTGALYRRCHRQGLFRRHAHAAVD